MTDTMCKLGCGLILGSELGPQVSGVWLWI